MMGLLLDLDGVLRTWDPTIIGRAEEHAGLPSGALAAAAFGDPELLHRAVTGAIDDATWRAVVAQRLDSEFGGRGSAAVHEWSEPAGAVNREVLEIVRRERVRRPVGLLTNATSRLAADLERLGLLDEVDVVVNTADHGIAKPDPRIFEIAAAQLGCHVTETAFVDDTRANVRAAAALGLTAHLFTDAENLRPWLDSLDQT